MKKIILIIVTNHEQELTVKHMNRITMEYKKGNKKNQLYQLTPTLAI